jgi:hypothetical protein
MTPHLAAGTAAVLVMRMRIPRPPCFRLARQPGTVACVVALAVIPVIACWVAVTTVTGRVVRFSEHLTIAGIHGNGGTVGYPIYPFSGRFLVAYGDRIGFAVAGAWLSLGLAGCWRPEPTWIDRLGRAAGCLWLIATLVLWLRCYSV